MTPKHGIHWYMKQIGNERFFVVVRYGMRFQELCYVRGREVADTIVKALNHTSKFIQHTYVETYKGIEFHRTVAGKWMMEGIEIQVEGPTIFVEVEKVKKLIDKIKEEKPKHPFTYMYKGVGFHRKANGYWNLDKSDEDLGKYFHEVELARLMQSTVGLVPVDLPLESQIMRNAIDRMLRGDIVS